MARNPLISDPAREQRVRERAYHLWEADGKPHGHDVEYWERARTLIGMEESAGSGQLANPATTPGSPRAAGVEEFPDRLADEVKPTPAPRRRTRTSTRKAKSEPVSPKKR